MCIGNLVTPWHKMTEKEVDALLSSSSHLCMSLPNKIFQASPKWPFNEKIVIPSPHLHLEVMHEIYHTAFCEILKGNWKNWKVISIHIQNVWNCFRPNFKFSNFTAHLFFVVNASASFSWLKCLFVRIEKGQQVTCCLLRRYWTY